MSRKIIFFCVFMTFSGCNSESGEGDNLMPDAGNGIDAGTDNDFDSGKDDNPDASLQDSGEDYDHCWNVMDASFPEDISFTSIWGSSPEDIFAAGIIYQPESEISRGYIFHYNGQSWNKMDTPEMPIINSIHGSGSDSVYAVGANMAAYFYNGNDWTVIHDSYGDTMREIQDVWVSDADDIYAIVLFHIHAGNTVSEIHHYNGEEMQMGIMENMRFMGIWGTSDNNIYISAIGNDKEGGIIFHYDGKEGSSAEENFNVDVYRDVWGDSAENFYMVGSIWNEDGTDVEESKIIHYDGSSWMIVQDAIPFELRNLTGSSADDVYAAGINFNYETLNMVEGALYHYNGNEWSRMKIPGNWFISGLWAAYKGEAYAVGGYINDHSARIFRYSCDM